MDKFLNPKQELFLKNYLDPRSETFSNALQSGIKAGFSEEYSKTIMHQMPDWLSENLNDGKRLAKAESNLDLLLNQDDDVKVKADITKFVASTLGRRKYSTRTEADITSEGKQISQINYIVPAEAKVIPEAQIRDIPSGTDTQAND